MAVAFRAKAIGSVNATTGAVTFTDPGTAGDLLLAVFDQDASGTWTPPDGTWTSLGYTFLTFDSQSVDVFYKKQSAGVGGAITFTLGGTFGGATLTRCVMLAYSGCDPTNPIPVAAGIQANQTSQPAPFTVVSPSITTTVNGCMLVTVAVTDQDTIFSTTVSSLTAGYTQRDFSGTAADFTVVGVADQIQSTAGATGTATWVLSSSGNAAVVGYMIALAPPGGAIAPWAQSDSGTTRPRRIAYRHSSGGEPLKALANPVLVANALADDAPTPKRAPYPRGSGGEPLKALVVPVLVSHAAGDDAPVPKRGPYPRVSGGDPLPAVVTIPLTSYGPADDGPVSSRARYPRVSGGDPLPPLAIAGLAPSAPDNAGWMPIRAPYPRASGSDLIPPLAVPSYAPDNAARTPQRSRSEAMVEATWTPPAISVAVALAKWGYEPPWIRARVLRAVGGTGGEPLRMIDLTTTGVVRPPLWAVVSSNVLSIRDLDTGGRVVDTTDRTGLIGDT